MSTPDPAGRRPIPLPWILAVLLRERRALGVALALGGALSVGVALVQPRRYTSRLSFLAQASGSTGADGLAGLAGQLGISLGSLNRPTQSPQFYADLLDTRDVLLPLAADSIPVDAAGTRVPVASFLGIGEKAAPVVLERTVDALRTGVITTSVAARTTGLVSVWVRTRSPQASLAIAERLLAGLNRYNQEIRQSQAAAERRFVEGRLAAALAALRTAEDALQRFLQANRQFETASQLTFQRERLQREVDLRQQVVTGLAGQAEDARIREVRDTPVLTLIEKPVLPVLPDPRGRVRLVLLGTMAAVLLAALAVLLREGWRRQGQLGGDAESYALLVEEWRRVRWLPWRRAPDTGPRAP